MCTSVRRRELQERLGALLQIVVVDCKRLGYSLQSWVGPQSHKDIELWQDRLSRPRRRSRPWQGHRYSDSNDERIHLQVPCGRQEPVNQDRFVRSWAQLPLGPAAGIIDVLDCGHKQLTYAASVNYRYRNILP